MTLVTPTGVVIGPPDTDPELFWATAGAMGLTGVVVRATLRLIPVETSWMSVDDPAGSSRLEDLMAAMEESRSASTATAWPGSTASDGGAGAS